MTHAMMRLLLAAGLMAMAWGAAATTEPPSIGQLAQAPQFGRSSLSPDGKHIAVARIDERGNSLVIVNADTMQPTTELAFPSNSHVLAFHWANDEMLVVNRGQRFAGVIEARGTGELYAVSVDGSKRRYLFGARGGMGRKANGSARDQAAAVVIDPLRDDGEHVLIAAHDWGLDGTLETKPKVHRVNVYSGRREQIAEVPLNFPWITADNAGRLRFAYGKDDQRRDRTLRYDESTREWLPVDLGLGEFGSLQPIGFSADDQAFFATISEVGEPGCLYRLQLAGYARQKLACEPKFELERLMPSSQRGRPLAALYTANGPRAHVLDSALPEAQLLRTLSQAFAPASVELLSFSDDGARVLFSVSGDREPGRIYLYDDASRESRLVFNSHPALVRETLAPTAPISLQARDGTPLHGFVTLPPGAAPKQLPLVVMPHGGPYGVADGWHYDPEAQLLATRGYAVLKVNFRGSGGFGELFLRQGYRQWGGSIQHDIIDATRWAIDKGLADPARICIAGGSFGAYSALMSATLEPDLFRCAVGVAGVYDIERIFRRGDVMRSAWGRAYLAEVLGDDESEWQRQSPEARVEQLRVPVLLVHGDGDVRAPLSHAKGLAAALARHDKPHELYVIDGEAHGFARAGNRERYYRKLLQFVGEQIGVPAAGAGKAAR